jgi:hypothetical protein
LEAHLETYAELKDEKALSDMEKFDARKLFQNLEQKFKDDAARASTLIADSQHELTLAKEEAELGKVEAQQKADAYRKDLEARLAEEEERCRVLQEENARIQASEAT